MYQRILVPVDGSDTSNRGLDEAIRLARSSSGSIRLLHVVDELTLATGYGSWGVFSGEWVEALNDAGHQILDKAEARVREAGIPVEQVLIDTWGARLADVVVEQVKESRADVVVIGTHGRRGVGRMLLGSGAEQVLRHSPVPVLLVRAAQ